MKFCLSLENQFTDLLGVGLIPVTEEKKALFHKLINSSAFFIERSFAEYRPRFKQIIPYCVLKWQDKILTYQRRSDHTEERLAQCWSIGFGGHIDPRDVKNFRCCSSFSQKVLSTAIFRELNEELGFPLDLFQNLSTTITLKFFLNLEDESLVEQVHFGAVYLIDLKFESLPVFQPQDNEILDYKWQNFNSLCVRSLDLYENWSKRILLINDFSEI